MPVGMVTTYDLTVGVQLEVEDLIHVLSPFDVPLVGGQGADGRSALANDTISQKKYSWFDEELLTPRTTLGAGYTAGGSFITVAAGQRERFQTGDIVKIEAEVMRITGYGTTADTLTVTTAYAGSNANHANGADVVGVGSALPEGSDPPSPRVKDRVERYNVTEIFGPVMVQVSGTEQVIRKYGLPMNEFDYQVANRTKEQMVALEQAIIYGQRVEDTSNEWRSMGGMDFFITSNVDSTTTNISETAILNLMETLWTAGGAVDRLMVPPRQKRKIGDFTADLIRIGQGEDTRGRIVNYFESDFGLISILVNRWLRASDAFLFSRDQATILTLRPFVFEMLAKTGDSDKGQVVGEKGFKFVRQGQAAKFTALQP